MAGDSSSSSSRELDQTPTWAVAAVCAVMIIISIVLEKVLHRVGKVGVFMIFCREGKPFKSTGFLFYLFYLNVLFLGLCSAAYSDHLISI